MSYDVSLMMDTGNPDGLTEIVDCGNYTYNVSPMYYVVLKGGINSIDGLKASMVAIQLEGAISKLEKSPDKYKAMNPENGWGDYTGALQFLKTIRNHCLKHPLTIVKVY